jgi:hypothetical protein
LNWQVLVVFSLELEVGCFDNRSGITRGRYKTNHTLIGIVWMQAEVMAVQGERKLADQK